MNKYLPGFFLIKESIIPTAYQNFYSGSGVPKMIILGNMANKVCKTI